MARRLHHQIGEFGLSRTKREWQVVIGRGQGRRRRFLCAPSHSLEKAKAEFERFVRNAEAVRPDVKQKTVGEIVDAYIANREAHGKNADKMRWQWTPLKPYVEHLQPVDLEQNKHPIKVKKKGKIEEVPLTICHVYARARAEQVSKTGRKISRDTIYSELMNLRNAMNWAVKHGKMLKEKVNVWVPSQGKGRDTRLSGEEIGKLVDAIYDPKTDAHIRLFFLLDLATGARKGAITDLEWSRVDLDRRVIDFRVNVEKDILDQGHQKGRAIVPIPQELVDELRKHKEFAQTPYVIERYGTKVDNPKKGVRALLTRCGLYRLYRGAHALRHTLASMLAEAGFDSAIIAKQLGHEDKRTTEGIYMKPSTAFLIGVTKVVAAELLLKAVGAKRTESDEGDDDDDNK